MPGKCTTIRRRVYEEISGRIQISPQVQKVTVTFEVATNQSAVEKCYQHKEASQSGSTAWGGLSTNLRIHAIKSTAK